jgi:Fe2+ or Zn2+ uptake regulation protein
MLRGVELRVTRPRVAVLAAVHGNSHADTDSIIGLVRADLGEVSHQAVYDVCRSCGVIADVDCAVDTTPCLTASDDHGFAIDEAEVVYWGLCPTCSTANRS